MQWLTLDRATLTPTRTGNSWFDGSAGGDHGVEALTKALAGGGLDQLVILSFPRVGTAGPAVPQDQVDAFNKAMKQMGVGPIDAGLLNQQGQKLVVMGVPYGGDGSGWYTHGGGGLLDALRGWLMPDSTVEASSGAARFRFQSERPTFDTSSARTATTNTMTLRGSLSFNATLPAGATGGFQVAIIDPIDFTFGSQATFGTNGVADPVAGLEAMAKFINDNSGPAKYHVAVQSIGRVLPPSVPHSPYERDPGLVAWQDVTSALTRFGANPYTFNTVEGSYAFLGGPRLEKGEVADSSTTVAIDPTAPPKYEPGTLKGRARPRADGAFTPAQSSDSDPFTDSLYEITFEKTKTKPWRYTKADGERDWQDYADALAYISKKLPQLNKWAPNLRLAYVGNDNLTYSDSKTDLVRLPYPGDDRTCLQGKGRNQRQVEFTRAQFCNLSDQLQKEFDYLDATKTLFDAYQKALDRSGKQELVDLESLGQTIRLSVAPDNSEEIGLSVFEFLKALGGVAAVFGGEEVVAAYEALSAAYEFGMSLKADLSGAPVGDQINDKVTDVAHEVGSRLSGTANSLDRVRDVIISDWGRLEALGTVANGPGWSIDVPTTTSTLTTGANAFFSTELMPVAYRPWKLYASTNFGTPTVDGCNIPGYGHSFRGATASSWLKWAGDRDVPVWALGKNTWTVSQYAWPPQDLSDQIFLSTSQRGYGVHLHRFFWEQYEDPGSSSVACF
jgi:hypothetical protein